MRLNAVYPRLHFWLSSALVALTRALERGGGGTGQILPSPHVFCEYLSKYSFDRRDFFNSEKSHRISPPGGHQANYSALRRCVTSHATVLSCRSPIGWR